MPLYLGFDAGALGLSAVVIDIEGDRRRIVFDRTLSFARDFPGLAADQPATPFMWADALDRLLGRLAAAAEIAVEDLRAIAGSAFSSTRPQAYLAPPAALLKPAMALARQLTAAGTAIDSLSAYFEALLTGQHQRLSLYWQKRYDLPAATIVPWSADRESRRIAAGLTREGVLGIDFGVSDVISTHASTLAFHNGSLTRDSIRQAHGLDWDAVAELLRSPGDDRCIMLPWLVAEEVPRVAHAGLRRFGFDQYDAVRNIRGVIEGQLMAMANHAAGMSEATIDRIVATGDAAEHHAVLQVTANVFGVDVYRLDAGSSAALGAALRAYHADRLASGEPVSWNTVVSGFTDPKPGHRVSPNPRHVATYARLRRDYALLERLHRDRRPIC